MNKAIAYPLAGGTALYLALTGCATRGDVRTLRDQLTVERQARVELTDRVRQVETKPLLEGPIEILKDRAPFEYGSVLGALLSKYNDEKTREQAKQYSDVITVSPTNVRGFYRVHVGRDHNRDGKLTTGSGDRTYPVDGKQKWSFVLNEAELLQVLKDYMPNARQYQPATAPPVKSKQVRLKSFLRMPVNGRRQFRLPQKIDFY